MHWDDQFTGPPGVEGNVLCTMALGKDLYAGGQFSTVGGGSVEATNVAKWDGTSWCALGGGLGGAVYALAAGASEVYAGGTFTNAGSASVNRIARWDGSMWSPLGTGPNGTVYAIAVAETNVYVGGDFTTAGGTTVNRIAKWDGIQWSALGTGMGSTVRAILIRGMDVYAGGNFTTAGGVSANRIAKWDGTNWSALANGLSGVVVALGDTGTDLYAGGYFTSPQYIARWDGTNWNKLGNQFRDGVSAQVSALAVVGNAVYAGGQFRYATYSAGMFTVNYIAKWQNSAWSGLSGSATGVGSSVNALAAAGTNLWVGGGFVSAGGKTANGLARWDGRAWWPTGTATNRGLNGTVRAFGCKATDIYVGGAFADAGGKSANNIVRWDGSNWTALGQGVAGGVLAPEVDAITFAGTDLVAGGYFTTAGSLTASNIARWDGTNWYPLGNGTSAALSYQPYVRSIAVSDTNIYIGGTFGYADGLPVDHVAKWDGSSWSALGSGLGDSVYALAMVGDVLFAGGSLPYLERWTGSSWVVDRTVDNNIMALCAAGSNLYVAGAFTLGVAKRIALWDGTSWLPLGSGLDGTVRALLWNGHDLYAGGVFTTAGGLPAQHIAKWDGTSWSPLGSGLNGTVQALFWNGDDLYVGGDFTRAGGKASFHIARWNETRLFGLPSLSIRLTGNSVVVSWPPWATNYVLEASPVLGSPSWTEIARGEQVAITNDVSSDAAFYRLRLP